MHRYWLCLLSTLFFILPQADAAPGFETVNVVLYQPNSILSQRVPTVQELAGYINRLEGACNDFFAADTAPETLHVVVAVRPGKLSRIWFVSAGRAPGAVDLEPLRKNLEAIPPCDVHGGPIIFAISANIAGGGDKKFAAGSHYQPPIPKEWQDAAKGKKDFTVSDEFLDLVWPAAP